MASRMSSMFMLIVVAATVLQCATAQTSHVVGNSLGWIIPASSSVYSTWASKQTFKVGDSLVFNFAAGIHTAAEVSKADYDSCNSAATPIGSVLTASPSTIRLATAGNHYYICTVGGHCSAGQKLAINVVSGSAITPPAASPVATPPVAIPTPVASPTPATTPTPVGSPVPSPSTSPISTPPSMSPEISPSPSTNAMTPSSSPGSSSSTGGNGVLADSPAGSPPAAAPPSNSAISVAVSGFSLVALLSAFFM